MADTDLVDLGLAALLLLAGHALRAARWALFFRHEQVFQRFNLLLALALGYSINAIVPGRPGELVRIWFAARRESLRLPYVASTVVAERLADLVATAVRFLHHEFQTMIAGVILGLLAGVKAQADLALGVAAAGPAHQRIDLARVGGREFQHPALGLGGTGLHRGAGGLIDAHGHG